MTVFHGLLVYLEYDLKLAKAKKELFPHAEDDGSVSPRMNQGKVRFSSAQSVGEPNVRSEVLWDNEIGQKKAVAEFHSFQTSDVEKNDPRFVTDRKKLMLEPERWEEFVTRVTKLEGAQTMVADQQLRSIEAPTLVVAGDRDPYNQTDKFVEIYRLLQKGELLLNPRFGHLVLYRQPQLTIQAVDGFLDKASP